MKKFLLLMLVGTASYTSVYASNEVVNNTIISEEIEMTNSFETVQFNILDKVENLAGGPDIIYNCFTTLKMTAADGEQSSLLIKARTTDKDGCTEKSNGYKAMYIALGYEVNDVESDFKG